MLDTIPNIIDTSKIIIQNIIPGKTWWEINAPYVAVLVSLLTVVVNIWLNNRQIKNSHHILEKNIENNWQAIKKSSRFNYEIGLLNRFSELKVKITECMYTSINDIIARNSEHFMSELDVLNKAQIEVIKLMKIKTEVHLTVNSFRVFCKLVRDEYRENGKFDKDNYEYTKGIFEDYKKETDQIIDNYSIKIFNS